MLVRTPLLFLRTIALNATVLAVLVVPLRADQVQLAPALDNTLYQDPNGALSNGRGSAMFAGLNGQGLTRRAVLTFDVAGAVPAGATIDAVTLTLTENGSNGADQTIALHRLLASWGEGASIAPGNQGAGAPATPGDATWLHRFFNSDLWSAAGGDFAPGISTQTTVGAAGMYSWPSTAQLVAEVQGALDNPADYFGWALVGNESVNNSAKRFATRDEANAALRPVLTIDYTPIPEPATLGLLIPLALVLRRRAPS